MSKEIEELIMDEESDSLKYNDELHAEAGADLACVNQSKALFATLHVGIKKTKGTFENLSRTTVGVSNKLFEQALE